MSAQQAAFFDFDGTLTEKDTFLEFLKFSASKAKYLACLLVNSPFIVLFYLKLYPNYRLKEKFFGYYFKGKPASEVQKKGDQFCIKILPDLISTEALAVINWHKINKNDVYIITASSDIWLSHWCTENNVELIATSFETKDGLYTGKIAGKNCYGKEKVHRISHALQRYTTTYGYGDSTADQFFLDEMTHGFKLTINRSGLAKTPELEALIKS